MKRALALGLAAGLDAAFGDPPNAAHPVAWFGRLARATERALPGGARGGVPGLAAALALSSVAGVAAAVVERAWPRRAGGRVAARALVLSIATSRRTLVERATEVADALDADDLAEARRLLAFHLVSRDTSELDASEVAGAVVESVAENLSDGVIAPWCWFVLGGAPGAGAYRALNTLDGMWGYRTAEYEAFGKAAARADDLANLAPARLTALALVAAARALGGCEASRAFEVWRADAGTTASPNAGHPMAAMAGALGVRLGKRGEYLLGAPGRAPTAEDIRDAVRLAEAASLIALVALILAAAVRR